MRVVFAGTPEAALPSLDAIVESSHEVIGIATRPDARSGRGRRVTRSPIGQRGDELGVPVLTPEHPRDPEFAEALRVLAPDCCPVVAYGALLPAGVLDIPALGWVNLHFSALPAWRGAAPVQHAIRNGDEVTGATAFRIVEALDAGPIYGVMTERIRPRDTAGDLLTRLADGGAELLVSTLDGLEANALEARPQQVEGLSFAPKITVDDARIDWRQSAPVIDHQVRSCTPAPGSWTTFGGERVKIGPVRPAADGARLPPGELEIGKRAVRVGTGTTAVTLSDLQAHGRKQMAAIDWARGLRGDAVDTAPRFGDGCG